MGTLPAPTEATEQPTSVTCLNCGKPVSDRFCSSCGQEVGEPIPKVRDLLFELADEFLKFDSRLIRTAATLVRSPGALTLEYAKGRRADYIAPFKLYFGCSFIFYLVLPHSGWNLAPTEVALENEAIRKGVLQRMEFYYDNLAPSSIVLLPICSLVPALLYRKLKRPFLYHLVGTLHIWSGGFLIVVPLMVLGRLLQLAIDPKVIQAFTGLFFMGGNFVNQVIAYRRMYGGSWLGTILKSSAMLVFATFLGVVIMASSIAYFVSQEIRAAADTPITKKAPAYVKPEPKAKG